MNSTPTAVAIEGVSKVFNEGSDDRVEAKQGIDLHIQQGEFVSLIGPSGLEREEQS